MKIVSILSIAGLLSLGVQTANAHCQIPCGIYGDSIKFSELEQHIETISKSAKTIEELAGKSKLTAQDHQQLVRWVTNKETHAQFIIDEAANYFLAQRIKPDAEGYAQKVELLHHIIVFAMKAKQEADTAPVDTLAEKLAEFKKLYMGENADHKH